MNEFPSLETHLLVLPEWIDENGHMTANSYLPAFDRATETLFEYLDIGWIYADGTRSIFGLGMNLDFHRELLEGDHLSISTRLLDYDHKRIQFFHQMFQSELGYLASTNEILIINISIETRRSAPFSSEIQDRLRSLSQAHSRQGIPQNAFRQLKILRKGNSED